MNRALSDTVSQIVRKNQPDNRDIIGRILLVNYSTHRIMVKPRGYGILNSVDVQKGIVLGTTDRPVIVSGDMATLRRKREGRWVCIAVEHKERCAVGVQPSDEVEVDTFSSFIQQQSSSIELPDDLRLPPIEQLGQITLPEFRFPDFTTFICGLPPCTSCAPGGFVAGMAVVISSDVDHPAGCYIWSFRSGGCTCSGSPVFKSFSAWEAGLATPEVGLAIPNGNYVYYSISKVSLSTYRLIAIDVSVDTAPVQVDTLDSSIYRIAGMDAFGGYLYASTNLAGALHLLIYDTSTPSNLSLAYDYTLTDVGQSVQLFNQGGVQYLGIMVDDDPTAVEHFLLRIIDVTNPASVSVVGNASTVGVSLRDTGRDGNRGWHVTNNHLYSLVDVTNSPSFGNYIFIYDLTDPTSPVESVQYNTGYTTLDSLRANTTHLWVGARSASSVDQLLCYDISNPVIPVLVSDTDTTTTAGTSAPIDSIVICGDRLFLSKDSGIKWRLETWDISDPAVPVFLNTQISPDNLRVRVDPLRLNGSHLYMAGSETAATTAPRLAVMTC